MPRKKEVPPLTVDQVLVLFRAARHISNALATLGNAEEFPLYYNPRPVLWKANDALSAVLGRELYENRATIDAAYAAVDEATDMPERVEWQRHAFALTPPPPPAPPEEMS